MYIIFHELHNRVAKLSILIFQWFTDFNLLNIDFQVANPLSNPKKIMIAKSNILLKLHS